MLLVYCGFLDIFNRHQNEEKTRTEVCLFDLGFEFPPSVCVLVAVCAGYAGL